MFPLLILFFSIKSWTEAESILSDTSVSCRSDSMVVSLSFSRPFSGSVFTEKGFEDSSCRWTGTGTQSLSASIPLSPSSNCGVVANEESGEVSVKVIVTPARGIIVDGFTALHVKCLYATQDITLTLPAGRPLLISGSDLDSSVVSGTGGSPVLSLAILEGHGIEGRTLAKASVGQRITLDAALKDTSIYDFVLHSCIAHDGSHSPDASINVVDDNGCGVRLSRAVDVPLLISQPVNGGPKHVYIHMYGFQFTSSQFVHFECQARPCVHKCKQEQCSSSPTVFTKLKKRLRREDNRVTEDDNSLDVLQLSTVLQIEPQQAHSSSLVSSSQPSHCVSQDLLIIFGAAFLGILIISLLVIIYCLRRPSRKEETGSENAYDVATIYR